MDKFTQAYITCALWSSCDDDGEPLDASHDSSNISPDTLQRMEADCKAFKETEHYRIIELASAEQNGHDFWLTRNGHGAGFWDRGYDTKVSDIVCASCKGYGSFDLYIGDDGMIHGQ